MTAIQVSWAHSQSVHISDITVHFIMLVWLACDFSSLKKATGLFQLFIKQISLVYPEARDYSKHVNTTSKPCFSLDSKLCTFNEVHLNWECRTAWWSHWLWCSCTSSKTNNFTFLNTVFEKKCNKNILQTPPYEYFGK